MLSIQKSYQKIQTRNPNLGTYPTLAQAIIGKGFARKSLVKAFKELMPEDEYAKDESKGLIDYLESLTNPSEEGEICAKFRSGEV